MPVNKHIGKLWFETEEEINQYDDLMVSNIELKDPDSQDENFTILALRERKEHLPYIHPNAKKQMESFIEFQKNGIAKKSSLASFWEFPIMKEALTTVGSYMIWREIPIRNFYARSFFMAFYLMHLKDTWSYYRHQFSSKLGVEYDPQHGLVNKKTI